MTADLTADRLIRSAPQAMDQTLQEIIAQAKGLLAQGIEFAKRQELQRAIAHFTQSIRLSLALLTPDLKHGTDKTAAKARSLSVDEVTTVEVTVTQSFYHRGCALSRLERYDRAIADFTHLIGQPPTSAAIPATWLISKLTEIYIHRGNAHRRLGEYSQALSDLNQAITRSEGSAQSYSCRGLIYLDIGDFETASKDFSAAIEQHPTFAQAYLWRGFSHLRSQQSQQAAADLSHAIAAIPTCAEAYNHRGIAHLHAHSLAQAQADFDQAIRINPSFAEAYNNRGNLHRLLGNNDSATADYDQAIAIAQTTEMPLAECYFNRVSVLADHQDQATTNDVTAALATAASSSASLALSSLSSNNAAFYRYRAQTKTQTGHFVEAIEDYTTAIAIAPNAYALYHRGRLYTQIGECEKALADFDRALVRSPDYAAAYCDRSHLRFQSHDLPGTLADTNKAIELALTHHARKSTLITRSLTHFCLGNKQQALEDFEQLVILIENQQHQVA